MKKAVVELAIEEPVWGQVRAANELKKKAITISPAGVRCVWLRHDLENIKSGSKHWRPRVCRRGGSSLKLRWRLWRKPKRTKKPTGNLTASVLGTVEHRTPCVPRLLGFLRRHLSTDLH